MDDVSALVARQYEAYAYPEPIEDLAASVAGGYFQFGDPSLYAPQLWPMGRPSDRLRILSAGCGTIQGAYLAYTNPNASVVGLDISDGALAHEKRLLDKHNLTNLSLIKGDVRSAGAGGAKFDAIFCTGVLHHMADPAEGLEALREALAPGGVMVLMLYGATRRAGVYMLQDAFRRLGIRQDPDGVAFVRSTLKLLPEHHYAHWYLKGASELAHDAALVDTFLHRQDRAYTVPSIFELLERTGLGFFGWIDRSSYQAARYFPADSELLRALDKLPERERWAVTESLTLNTGTHVFVAGRPDSGRARFEQPFERDDWGALVPHWSPGMGRAPDGTYGRGNATYAFTQAERWLFERINGARTILEITEAPELFSYPAPQRLTFARRAFENAWNVGNVMLSGVPFQARPAP